MAPPRRPVVWTDPGLYGTIIRRTNLMDLGYEVQVIAMLGGKRYRLRHHYDRGSHHLVGDVVYLLPPILSWAYGQLDQDIAGTTVTPAEVTALRRTVRQAAKRIEVATLKHLANPANADIFAEDRRRADNDWHEHVQSARDKAAHRLLRHATRLGAANVALNAVIDAYNLGVVEAVQLD